MQAAKTSRLGWLLLCAGVAVHTACGSEVDRPGPSGDPEAVPVSYVQAPLLADSSQSGALPAVGDRLPRNPLVVTPFEEMGSYGGTWRMAMIGSVSAPDEYMLLRTLGYEVARIDALRASGAIR